LTCPHLDAALFALLPLHLSTMPIDNGDSNDYRPIWSENRLLLVVGLQNSAVLSIPLKSSNAE